MGKRLRRSMQVVVTLACFVVLWRFADGGVALRQLAAVQPIWIAGALIALTLQTLLSALRWQLTASRLGITMERGTAVCEYYLSQIVNQTLPGGVLGDAGRAYRARNDAGLAVSGQAVVFERLAGQIGLLAVFALGLLGARWVPAGVAAPGWALPLLLVISFLAVAGVRAAGRGAWVRSPPLVRQLCSAFWHAILAQEVRRRQCALSLGTAVCNIAAFACCAVAVGMPLSVPAALVLVPLVLFTMLIPLTVSGWGLREGAAAALLPLAGGTSAAALAASVAFGMVVFLAALPGLLALGLAAAPDPAES